MKAVAITLEGVLRKSKDTEAQDFGAALLYMTLASHFRVIVLGTDNQDKDEHWLLTNGMIRHSHLEPESVWEASTVMERKKAQVTNLRAMGYSFEFIIVPDPELAVEIYKMGIPTLLYLHPLYSAAPFRPDYSGGTKSWDKVVAEIDYARDVKAEEAKKRANQEANDLV